MVDVLSAPPRAADEEPSEPVDTGAPETGRPNRRRDLLVLALISLVLVVVGLVQAANDAPTVDEGVEITAGVVALTRHDLRLTPEHAVVVKLGAAPALLAHPLIPDTAAFRSDDWFAYNDQFISANRRAGKLHQIVFLSRLLPLAEVVACGLLIYALGRRLFGGPAGLLAYALWATIPVVVGLGHFITIDVTFTLATLAVSLALLRFLERPGLRPAAVVGLMTGLALATRQSALVLLALVVVVVVVSLRRDRKLAAEAVGLVVGVSFAAVWIAYRVVAPSAPGGAAGARLQGAISQASGSGLSKLVTALPLPLEWRAGFAYLQLTSTGRAASLLGQSWTGTRWWYFPVVLVAKVPWGALLAIAVGCWCIRRLDQDVRRRAAVAVGAPALVLLAFTMLQPLQLGVRLLLPSLALGLVLAGPIVVGLRSRAGRIGLGALALTQVAAFAVALPHPLTWTPPPLTPNYRWVADSNIDYGQAEFELEHWSRGKDAFVAVANTRGLARPSGTKDLLKADPKHVTGWVAVGVTPLMELHRSQLSWLRAYCPVGTLGGGAILLYRFDGPPDTSPGPAQPAAACSGARSSR